MMHKANYREVFQHVILRSDVFDRTEESDSREQILQSLRSFRMTFCIFLVSLETKWRGDPCSGSLREVNLREDRLRSG